MKAQMRDHLSPWLFENSIVNFTGLQSDLFRPVRREEHLRRAFDHLRDALGRRRRLGLKNERQKQRRLTELDELRRRVPAVLYREVAAPDMRVQIGGEAVDSVLDHALIKTAADIGHPFGDRHHGADRGSAAWPAQQMNVGLAEIPQRRGDIAPGGVIERDLALFERFLLDNGLEQPVLVGEIDIQRSLGDAGSTGDFAHAGAVKAEIHEDFAGAGENLPAFGAVLFAGGEGAVGCGCNHWFSFSRKIAPPGRSGKELPFYNIEYSLTE